MTGAAPDLVRAILDFPSFCETFVRIKTKERAIVPLKMNSVQKFIWNEVSSQERKKEPVRIVVLKARQMGVSTLCQAYAFYQCTTVPNTHALAVAHDIDSTRRIFEMARLMYEMFPEKIRPARRYSNRKELVLAGLHSRLEIGTAGKVGVARGSTYQFLHLSEVALWPDADELISALFPSVPYQPGTAIILESTAKGAGNWWHEFWMEAKRGDNPFKPVFVPWFWVPEYTLSGKVAKAFLEEHPLDSEEKDLVKRYRLSQGQIAWRRMKIKELGERIFRQEFPSDDQEPWLVSGVPVFDEEALKRMLRKASPGTRGYLDSSCVFCEDPSGPLEVWEPPEKGARYTVGADVGTGSEGGSYSCAQVVRSGQDRQVAEWHGRLDPISFAAELEKLSRWYNDAMVAVEINSIGLATQAELVRRGVWNLYRWRYLDRNTDRPTDKVGWETSPRTRQLLIAHMSSLISSGQCTIRGKDLIVELLHFVEDELTGTPHAAPGFRDDRVMAWMIACFCDSREYPRGRTTSVVVHPEEHERQTSSRVEGYPVRIRSVTQLSQEEVQDWRTG